MVLTLVTVAPSFADPIEWINIDWIESTDGGGTRINLLTGAVGGAPGGAGTKGSMFGELSDDVAAGAQYIHFIGWYMPLAELADVGVSIDGADPVYGGYMTYEQALVDSLAAFDNVAYVRRVNFYYPIEEGSHTLELVAKFTDETTKVIYNAYYNNGGNVALNKPVYSTISTVPEGGACFNSNNEFWNINYINDGSATLFVNTVEPLGWYASSATPDVESTVTIDLQGQYDVTRVNLLAMGFNNAAFPNTYRVLASADGVNWQDIGGEEGIAANFFDKIATYATDVTARYIRIYITKFNPVDVYYAGVGEVEVFGTLKEEDNTKSIFEPFTSYDAGTAATADPGGNAAWTGFSTGDLDFEFTFKTDVSFWKIEFPGFWSSAATPVTFTFYQDGVEVHSFDYTTVGDGAISLPIGTTLPAGKYTCVMTINDDSVNAETGNYNRYVVLGYATAGKLLDDEYFTFERGKVAFNIYSSDIEGEGFVKLHTPESRDFSADAGDGLSFDRILVNGELAAEGNANIIALKKLVDGSDGSISTVGFYGWYGNANSETDQFGYTIDGGEPVFGDFIIDTEPAVTGLNANNRRYQITVDVSKLAKGKDHTIRVVAKLKNGDVVTLNRVDNPGEANEKDRDTYIIFRAEAVEAFSLDALAKEDAYLSITTNYNTSNSVTINEGESLRILGWVYRTYTNLEKIVYKIGEGNEVDCVTSYRARTELSTVLGVDAAYLENSGFGLDNDLLDLPGIENLEAGDYTVKIIAKFADGNTTEIKEFALTVEAVQPGQPTWVTTGKIVNTDTFAIVDGSGNTVATPASKTELGQLKSTVAAGGTKIKQYGWIYPEKAILTIGYMTDDGEITWGCEYYDQAIVDVFNASALPYAALALRFDTSRVNGGAPILEGNHTYKLVVKYSDETYEVLHSATYSNNDELVAEWVANNPASQNTVGLWLNQADSYAYAAFTATAPFEAVKIPVAWSSIPTQGKAATFEFALYKFVNNFDESLQGTPIATVNRAPQGDEATGYGLEFTEQEAGQYIVVARIISLESGAYTVLPVLGDATKALYKLNNAANAETFNFAVKTKYPTDFFGDVPEESETPAHVPETRDFSADLGDALSYDQILVNGTEIANGNADVIAAKQLISNDDGNVTTISMHGWYGNANLAIDQFGYTVDGGEPVFGDFKVATEAGVYGAGGQYASRFTITVDVSGFAKNKVYKIQAVAKLSNGDVVILNRFDNPGEANEKDRDIYVNYRSQRNSGFSLDAFSTNNTYPAAANPNYNTDAAFSINQGDKLYALGWAYRTLTNLNKVVYIMDNGDDIDCTGTFRSRTEIATVIGVDEAYLQNSGFGVDTGLIELAGIDQLEAGTYRLRLVAIFDDETRLEMYDGSLTVEAQQAGQPTWVTTGKIVNTDTFAIVDGSGNTVATPASKTELGQLKSTVLEGGTKIKQYGWIYPEKAILTIGYMTDDGEITWGCEYYDQAIVDVFNASALPYAALALRFDTSRVNGGAPILEGNHTYKLVVKYSDETYEVLHSATYSNNDELVAEWVANNPASQNTVGLWLNQGESYAYAAFTANAAFTGVKIPVAWSSIPAQSKSATFEFAIYNFSYNIENSVKGTPIATVTRTPAGDEASGYMLEFDELPAGEYVIGVKIVSLDAEAYTVLPVQGDATKALFKLNKASNAETFNFAVKTVYPEGFFGDIPEETDAPAYTYINGSFDSFFVDGVLNFSQGDGLASSKLDAVNRTVEAPVSEFGIRGWVGFAEAIDSFGYKIGDADPVFDAAFTQATEDAVKNAGGANASRYMITVPVTEVDKTSTIVAIVKLANGEVVALDGSVPAAGENDLINTSFTYSIIPEVPEGSVYVDPSDVEVVSGQDTVINPTGNGQDPVEGVVIGGQTVGEIIANGGEGDNVQINLDDSQVVLDHSAVEGIAEQGQSADADLGISVEKTTVGELTQAQQQKAADMTGAQVFVFDAQIGGASVSTLGSGKATISVPYQIPDGVDEPEVRIAAIDENGNVEEIAATYENGVVTFNASRPATFVAYVVSTAANPPTADTGIFATVVVVFMIGALAFVLVIRRKESEK